MHQLLVLLLILLLLSLLPALALLALLVMFRCALWWWCWWLAQLMPQLRMPLPVGLLATMYLSGAAAGRALEAAACPELLL